MVGQRFGSFLAEEGYTKISSNLPEFTFYFRMENNYTNVFQVINYENNLYISEDQYKLMKGKIKDFFAEKNIYDIHILSVIICQEAEKAKLLCKDDPFCWQIDPFNGRLMIYENQVDDFYGMKNKIEYFLAHIESFGLEEHSEAREAFQSGKQNFWLSIPYITVFLILVNVLVFLICTFTGSLLYNKGAFNVRVFWEGKEYYRILTSVFLHWDIDHLISNMLILYCLGEVVEKHFGRIKYTVIYISAGILGNCLSGWHEIYEGAYINSVGASGAIFGIIGALFILVCINKGHLEQITMGRLLLMIIYSLYSGFVGEGINNAAHIGGFVSGMAIALLLWLFGKKKQAEMRDC